MDIRNILRSPSIYLIAQWFVGGIFVRNACLKLIHAKAGERVLDIGCGPAYYIKQLPPVEYFGFDTNHRYIKYARSRFGNYGTFFCEEFTQERAKSLGKFDCVLLMGLLHHLDDIECCQLLTLIRSVLGPSGRVVALDTTVHNRQHPLSRFIATSDRGNYVRQPAEYMKLAELSFESVTGKCPTAWWMPSIFWCMQLQKPRLGQA